MEDALPLITGIIGLVIGVAITYIIFSPMALTGAVIVDADSGQMGTVLVDDFCQARGYEYGIFTQHGNVLEIVCQSQGEGYSNSMKYLVFGDSIYKWFKSLSEAHLQ